MTAKDNSDPVQLRIDSHSAKKHLCRQRTPGATHQTEHAGLGHRATGGAYQWPANTRVPQWVRRRGQVHSGQNIPRRRGGLHVGTIDRRRLFAQNAWRFVLARRGVTDALGRRSPRRTTLPHDSAFRQRLRCSGRIDRFRAAASATLIQTDNVRVGPLSGRNTTESRKRIIGGVKKGCA